MNGATLSTGSAGPAANSQVQGPNTPSRMCRSAWFRDAGVIARDQLLCVKRAPVSIRSPVSEHPRLRRPSRCPK